MKTRFLLLKRADGARTLDLAQAVAAMAVAAAVYLCTVCRGVYPGSSALETAQAMGLAPATGHSVALAAARVVAALPVRDVPLLLNIFNAMCGGLAVALFYLVAKQLILELTRLAPDVCAALEILGERERLNFIADEPERTTAATLGGVLGALTLAFSAPFWRASTAYSEYPWDAVLLLLLFQELLRCYSTGEKGACISAMLVCGIGVAESPVFLAFLPVTVILVICTVIHAGLSSEQVLPCSFLAGLAGFAAGIGLYALLSQAGGVPGEAANAVQAFARAYRESVSDGLCAAGWFPIWAVPLLTMLLSFVCVRMAALREEGVGFDGWALIVTLACVVIAQLTVTPYSVWHVARASGSLPVFPSLMTAMAAACVYTSGFIAAATPRMVEGLYGATFRPFQSRAAGSVVCGALIIAVLRQPCVTAGDADGRRAEFAGRVAQELLILYGSEMVVPVGGMLDLSLRLRGLALEDQLKCFPRDPALVNGAAASLPARLARFEAMCGPLLDDDPSLPPWLARSRLDLRAYVFKKMNELGKICDVAGCAEYASLAYGTASRMRANRERKGEL